jgi:hypothetical protein
MYMTLHSCYESWPLFDGSGNLVGHVRYDGCESDEDYTPLGQYGEVLRPLPRASSSWSPSTWNRALT